MAAPDTIKGIQQWPTLKIVFHEHTREFSICGCGGTIEHEHVMMYRPDVVIYSSKATKNENEKKVRDPYVMYLIVKTSLKMNAGKVAAQCGHAVQTLFFQYNTERAKELKDNGYNVWSAAMRAWLDDDFPSYAKIVLGASDKDFEIVKESKLARTVVTDRSFAGGVAAGTETVVGLWPVRKSEAPESVKKLKLLR